MSRRDPPPKYRNAFPAYKVYAFGAEITKDVTSIRINNNIGRTPNTCTLELLNKQDRYIVTRDDMSFISTMIAKSKSRALEFFNKNLLQGLSTLDKPTTDQLAKVSNPNVEANDASSIKGRVVATKLNDGVKYSGRVTGVDGKPGPPSFFPRYPWKEGRSIFHAGDPVRVFLRDPFVPDVWWHGFAGFITDQSESYNENNVSILTISLEDVMRLLRFARISINPAIVDVAVDVINDENTPNKLQGIKPLAFSGWVNPFSDMTLFQFLETLFYGTNPKIFSEEVYALMAEDRAILSTTDFNTKWSVPMKMLEESSKGKGASSDVAVPMLDVQEEHFKKVPLDGVGRFSRRSTKIGVDCRVIGSPMSQADKVIGQTIISLKEWQKLVSHQVLTRDLVELRDQNIPLPTSMLLTVDPVKDQASPQFIMDMIGQNPALFPIEGKVRLLVPANLGSGNLQRNVLDRQMRTQAFRAEYFDRLNLLYDAMEAIDFNIQVSPRGDVLIEMPLYDFDPDDFGSGESDYMSNLEVENKKRIEDSIALGRSEIDSALAGEGAVGDYNKLYGGNFSRSYTGGESTRGVNNQALIATAGRVRQGRQIEAWEEIYTINQGDTYNWTATDSDDKIKTVIFLHRRWIASMSGYTDKEFRKPIAVVLRSLIPVYGVRIEQGEAAHYVTDEDAARIAGLIRLQRQNADAFSVRLQINPRFGLNLNRPVIWRGRNHIITAMSVSHTVVWNSACHSEVSGNFSRGWEGKIDNQGRDIYTPIGGAVSRPLNYAALTKASTQGPSADGPLGRTDL